LFFSFSWFLTSKNLLKKCFSDALIVTYLLCHIVGVSSTCTNPILYGLLNFNFLAEYNIIMEKLKVMKNGKKSNESVQVIIISEPLAVCAPPRNSGGCD
jgi:hypothetical protein